MQAAGGRWADWALGAGRAGRAAGEARTGGRPAGARGEWQAGCRHGARGRQILGARGARQAGAGRWARGLGARVGQSCALGPLRLVFNSVFQLGIFPESLNEHCSL